MPPRVTFALLLGTLLPACADKMNLYGLDQISTLTATSDGSEDLRIEYRPMSASLYYSPGVALSEHPDHVEVRFVRCRIQEKCFVTHAAKAAANGTLAVVIARPSVSVRVTDGKHVKELFRGGTQ